MWTVLLRLLKVSNLHTGVTRFVVMAGRALGALATPEKHTTLGFLKEG